MIDPTTTDRPTDHDDRPTEPPRPDVTLSGYPVRQGYGPDHAWHGPALRATRVG